MAITLKPVDATPELMQRLEEMGLIERLTASNAVIANTPVGQTLGKTLYETKDEFGAHKLISVSVNRRDVRAGIGYHPDREDFLVISTVPNANPLFLVISPLSLREANQKIATGTLCEDDFILLRMRYGDPDVSFFTMKPGVLHGEATIDAGGECPVFYVTEPANMPLYLVDFRAYQLEIGK